MKAIRLAFLIGLLALLLVSCDAAHCTGPDGTQYGDREKWSTGPCSGCSCAVINDNLALPMCWAIAGGPGCE
ncbi:hypothetical protein HOLleu_19293 [Holothuria leucospilota]|uniref:Uncharacterized protein n=1 Tax=Holothuria leucospilota TaxID=206669 RepID=A0A9Q1BZG0_HOLLE|nr:hypothetical protein HOLleu_19293 [Holothuria leucospilota]